MATKKQIMANRANAQKSTGPKTAEGREVASRNAATHGLFTKDAVAAGEDQQLFDTLLKGLAEEHQPGIMTEALIVERIALAFWREKRLARAEKMMMESSKAAASVKPFDCGIEPSQEPRETVVGNALAEDGLLAIQDQLLIGRYQTMISNQIRQALKDLRDERSFREKTIDGASFLKIANDGDDEPAA
jgi:hypothetical protein